MEQRGGKGKRRSRRKGSEGGWVGKERMEERRDLREVEKRRERVKRERE